MGSAEQIAAADRAAITAFRGATSLPAARLLSYVVRPPERRVDGERYDLYFGSLKVGVVTETASDFPSLWGTIAYEPWVSNPQSPEEGRFAQFVALNKESTRLMDMGDEVDVACERAAVNAELEAGYKDYNVWSEEWWLVDRGGRKLPILCPILRGDGDLVWRWDPRRV